VIYGAETTAPDHLFAGQRAKVHPAQENKLYLYLFYWAQRGLAKALLLLGKSNNYAFPPLSS